MASIEICLVVVGLVLVIGSFILVEKLSDKELQEIAKYNEFDLKRITEKEVEKAKEEIAKSVEESLAESKEMIADSFSEVTNEKMIAISEYSDTVLNEINKRHQEVMFLYKMLTEKQDGIQEIAGEMNRTKEDIRELLMQVVTRLDAKSADTEIIDQEDIKVYTKEEEEQPEIQEQSLMIEKETDQKNSKKTQKKKRVQKKEQKKEPQKEKTDVPEGDKKSKDEIIRLHKNGVEDVEIAKILNMGVGEIKLILDLYRKDHETENAN